MKISKAEYEDMIRKKPSLRPTEVIKSQNTHEKLIQRLLKDTEEKWKENTLLLKQGGPFKMPPEIIREGYPIEALKVRIAQQNPSLMPKTHQIRPSQDESKLNKTERAWLAELRIRRPKFLGIQSMTFKLGDDCRYTPDFVEISQEDKFIAWEVKGFMRDDALVKLKVAARMFAFIEFYVVKRIKGSWETKKINP